MERNETDGFHLSIKSGKIWMIAMFVLLSVTLQAKDYYVSVNGNNAAGTDVSPANVTQLKSFLATYDIATDSLLNIFFYGGTYTIPSGGFSFNTTKAKVGGLNVVFQPVSGETVTFTGTAGNTKLLHLNAGPSADKPLTVTVENITIRNFSSDANEENGGGQLFTVMQYNALMLQSVTVRNISSKRNPLLALHSDATFHVVNSTIDQIRNTLHYSVFESIASNYTLSFVNSTLSNWSTTEDTYNYMFYLENNNGTITMDGCTVSGFTNGRGVLGYRSDQDNVSYLIRNTVFENNRPTHALLYVPTASNKGLVQFSGCRFTGNTVSGSEGKSFFQIYANTVVTDCIFENNTVQNTNNSEIYFFDASDAGAVFSITGSTLSGNTLTTTSVNRHLFHTGGTTDNSNFVIINNTFSGNNNVASVLYTRRATGAFINNTLYHTASASGTAISTRNNSASTVVANNLLVNSGTLSGGTGNFYRNIVNNLFYATGNTNGTACDVTGYIDPNLSEYAVGKPKIHRLLNIPTNPILKKGGQAMATSYAGYLLYDQRYTRRPPDISAGSVDVPELTLMDAHYTIFYDRTKGLSPPYLIDMRKYIASCPDGADTAAIQFNITAQPATGQANAGTENYLFNFTPLNTGDPSVPAAGILDHASEMHYTATYGGETATAKLTIVIADIHLPSGIIDGDYIKCFTGMGQTDFSAGYKFITKGINNTRYDGFTIPLVGDLNGDGKPEIVTIGLESTSAAASLYGNAAYLCILNGQTGKEIVRYPLPSRWDVREPVHNTPSWLALVDADRNGRAEIIVACGYAAGTYRKRLICYEVNSETFLPASSSFKLDSEYRLTLKWVSSERYDMSSTGVNNGKRIYAMPLPQIADIDQDGIPEVIVYNKVYNALNGQLLITLEDLEPVSSYPNRSLSIAQARNYAYIGRNRYTSYWDDKGLNFSSVYDLDADGRMEIIAGGKVYYDLNPNGNPKYKVKSADHAGPGNAWQPLNIGDGYTGVADVNSDGKAEIVVVSYTDANQNSMRIRVWDPGFSGNIATTPPVLLANVTVRFSFSVRLGSLSHVYIGDIDGKTDSNGKKYPEISVLGPRFYNREDILAHPNLPSNSFGSSYSYSASAHGALMSWTWDASESAVEKRLKVSFLLEHDDTSLNTGFTMFDFDNDGTQEICYRDETSLRIISASQALVKLNETSTSVIKFKSGIRSYTGFEYPVIADIDGDGSADMIVMGSDRSADARGYVYAVQANPARTKFAPALMVWNQFMYSPLKINENLTTPRLNIHPLSPGLSYVYDKDKDSGIRTFIYNNTITQAVKSSLFDEANTAGDTVSVLKPIVFSPDAQVYSAKISTSPAGLVFSIRNNGNGTLNAATSIRLFRGKAAGYVPSGYYGRIKLGTDLFPNDSITLTYPFLNSGDLGYNYTIRVSDSTYNSTELFMRYYEDCNWADNVAEVGSFLLRNDAATVLQGTATTIDLLANDVFPTGCSGQLSATSQITTPGGQGVLSGNFGTFAINNNRLEYTAPSGSFPDGVVEVTYSIACNNDTRTAKLYIYIVEPCIDFVACKGCPYRLCLNKNPAGKAGFEWYSSDDIFVGTDFPLIPNPQPHESFYVKPRVIDYETVDFPRLKIDISLIDIATGPVYRLPNTD
jgi:hypothetical protein